MFHKILRELRLSRRIKTKTVAEKLNIAYRTYQRYETGEVDPTLSKLLILAELFDVSVDYLAGRTDNPKQHT